MDAVQAKLDQELYSRWLWRSANLPTTAALAMIVREDYGLVAEALKAMEAEGKVKSSGNRWYKVVVQ